MLCISTGYPRSTSYSDALDVQLGRDNVMSPRHLSVESHRVRLQYRRAQSRYDGVGRGPPPGYVALHPVSGFVLTVVVSTRMGPGSRSSSNTHGLDDFE
jgi:hypothetical protein